jgi:hypothetical protein
VIVSRSMPRRPRLPAPLVASAAAIAAAGALTAAPARASSTQTVYFEPNGALFAPATRARTLAKLEHLGVHGLRILISWDYVAPSPNSARPPRFLATSPTSYNWEPYAWLIEEAQRLHWQVLLTVSGPAPRWATAGHRDHLTRPSTVEFQQFMTAVGRRFGGDVSVWAVWNEPNQVGWLLPQFNPNGSPASPAIYRGLFEAGYRGLRAAGIPQPRVLMGETAPFGESFVNARRVGTFHNVSPLAFLRGMLCLDARYRRNPHCHELPAYGYAHHGYTTSRGPFYVPPGRDEVTIGSLGRLTRALDRAAHAGAIRRGMPVYLTEFGINTRPNSLGVSPQEQAVQDAVAEKMAWQNGRVAAFSQYELRDDPIPRHHGSWIGFQTGLETAAGRPKPLYYGWPLPLVVSRVRGGYSLWGLIRPASGVTRAQIFIQRGRGQRFQPLATVRTGPRGYWLLRSPVSGSYWRVRWTSPRGAVYLGPPIPAT